MRIMLLNYEQLLNGNIYINDVNGNLYSPSSNITLNTYNEIVIHPNPTKDIINVIVPPEIRNYNISLFNMLGENILSTFENQLNLEGLKSGVYLIIVKTDNQIFRTKIIKE